MIVNIKYFGLLNEKMPISIELPDDSNLKAFKKILIGKADKHTAEVLNRATFLVNKSKADNETVLKHNDLIMILSVLGGG